MMLATLRQFYFSISLFKKVFCYYIVHQHTCDSTHMEVKEQSCAICSLLPTWHGNQGLNKGCQAQTASPLASGAISLFPRSLISSRLFLWGYRTLSKIVLASVKMLMWPLSLSLYMCYIVSSFNSVIALTWPQCVTFFILFYFSFYILTVVFLPSNVLLNSFCEFIVANFCTMKLVHSALLLLYPVWFLSQDNTGFVEYV